MRYFIWLGLFLLSIGVKAQQTSTVDFTKLAGTIHLLPESKSVKGEIKIDLKILKATDSIYLDAKNSEVNWKQKNQFDFKTTIDKIWIIGNFEKGKSYSFNFKYQMNPKQAMYFVGWDNEGSNQIWTQGQGKYTSHWLPSIDDLNEKIEFDLAYQVPKNYTVIANGKLTNKKTQGNQKIWSFDMKNPMSSYLVAVAVGDYAFAEEKSFLKIDKSVCPAFSISFIKSSVFTFL